MKLFRLLFPINRDNLFKGTTYAMILAATLHLTACLYVAIRTGNPDVINMFNIIGVSLLFPSLGHGELNSLLGIIMVILVGTGFYIMQQWHSHIQAQRTKK